MNAEGWLAGFLAASSRRGSILLACGIFAGVLLPPLAHAFRQGITPMVVGLMTLVLLRVDIAAAFRHLRRPVRLTAVVAFQMLASPVLVCGVTRLLSLEPAIAAGTVLFATGATVTSSPAFARLVGLDPELSLLATLASTLLLPLTAPPIAYGLIDVDLSIGLFGFMGRLLVIVGAPLLASLLLRQRLGPARLEPAGAAIDGAVVWLLVLYGVGVMDGMAAQIAGAPLWMAEATLAAFTANLGLNLMSATAFSWMGPREAATVGLVGGNRNMAVYLAVLPAAADPRIGLFFVLCQFPLYLSPFLLRPLYRRLLGPPA